MTSDAPDLTPHALLDQVSTGTTRVLETVRKLTDDDLRAPSLLPGWTRGHVVAHLARNADSLVNLLIWARTGVEIAQYPSAYLRDADIEAGAPRPAEQLLLDLRAAVDRFSALATTAPAESWSATVRTRQGKPTHASAIARMRLLEVEIHHVDLAASYTPADWPSVFVADELPRVAVDIATGLPSGAPAFALESTDSDFRATLGEGEPEHTVTGPSAQLLAWLIGRSSGNELAGPLPGLPAWR
ncbi:maleylpyruvate isomerase family mycothiol-dependent enzyme [Nocardia shimofusensis]|uniref:maleylpyruvate isomerase family mycothiol-dependent enzyme n=1 Tax=Nocardia shimofusensis TaxID=228596 RepID=UPI00082FCF99|nr:maleylpyruvate isomerase family mycothiol-dependent enzyme [Nocardia shimofusensis]